MQPHVTNFRGLIDLDKTIVEQLENYLKEKEERLSCEISSLLEDHLIKTPQESSQSDIFSTDVKLADSVESFIRNVRLASHSKISFDKQFVDNMVQQLNMVFWDYTEALEGCVIELFQQIKQVSVDRWHLTIAEVVHAIRNLLANRIEDLVWTIRRLKEPLQEFCEDYQSKNLPFWKKWTKSYLDEDLLKNLKQSHQYLQTHYESFNERHETFTNLSFQVEEYLETMKTYPVLARLDIYEQNVYIDVYRLLKMIELNQDPKSVLKQETIRSLKYLASVDSIFHVFRHYSKEIYETMFTCSLEYKYINNERDSPYFEDVLNRFKEKVESYQVENQSLLQTICKYREFILNNDSNPYVSSRWGFTERTVGPEPITATKLLNLTYFTEELGQNYADFSKAIAQAPDEYFELKGSIHQEIDKLLHEMGQPLISHLLMQNRAERLLEEIQLCNELGSPDIETIDYIESVLSKAMREDWKYHVLHDFKHFHEVYRIHLGLCPRFDDPAHAFRNERFHLFFNQIEGWVKKGDLFTHIHEIELDINDIKTYLQDFLASVQRSVKDKTQDSFLDDSLRKYRQQLLEYRYIFGQFFSSITKSGMDGQQLRIQFLFVDQYFESVENLINSISLDRKNYKNLK